ncbi:MAG TPA: HDIG domain-containing protein [Trueperaceae bacterium]|nr:HDIG domain-containing protein [Trueperaceae bacterium]
MSNRGSRPKLVGSRAWLLFTLCVVSLTALLFSVYGGRGGSSLAVGETSPQTFVAPVDTQVIDRIATERERQAARQQIGAIFTSDPELRNLVTSAVTSSNLPATVVDFVVNAYNDPNGVKEAQIPPLIDTAVKRVPADRQSDVRRLLQRYLVATSVPNPDLTQAARDAAANSVQPVMQSLRAGQVIVREGQKLTQDNLRVMEALGLYSARTAQLKGTAWILLGSLLVALLLSAPLLYARRTLRTSLSMPQLTFLTVLTLSVVAVQRLALLASGNFLFGLLLPLVVAVLLSESAGLMWAVWVALAVGLLTPLTPLFAVGSTLVGSVVAGLLVLTIRSRVALLLAGTAGGFASGITLAVLVTVNGGMTAGGTALGALFMLGGGVLSGIIALGLLPLAESGFGFLTDYRLLELSSPTSPLLQKLLIEAPGTYQHSLIISNLVEQAVKNIGGNALQARVGALYHDVGKMRRPHFFVENQFSDENPHDQLSPHLSFLIITSHVRDGLELLKDYKLPRELAPYVAEHHGTTVLSYFYKRALEDAANVEELSFRYPGPKPHSKETAVLMLADTVESASRTLSEPNQSSIRAMVDRLIEQRLQDDQLSQSPLNFHDLEVIANTFERMLTAILHRRISYPSPEEVRGLRRGSGDTRRDPAVPAG